MADFNEAVERSSVGLEKKSRIMQDDEKLRVAYHEAGTRWSLIRCRILIRSTRCRSFRVVWRRWGTRCIARSRTAS